VGPYLDKNTSLKRAGGVSQGVGSEFKPQYPTHTKIIFLLITKVNLSDIIPGFAAKIKNKWMLFYTSFQAKKN
jgi:hypothetical protein